MRKDKLIQIRVSSDEKTKIAQAAEEKKIGISEFLLSLFRRHGVKKQEDQLS